MERFFKRPWIIVAVVGALTLFFAAQLPRAQLDNNNFRFVPQSDPARMLTERIDDTFGNQVIILIGLERRYGTVLDADFLRKLRAYGEKIEKLEVVGSVQSIINTDYIDGVGDSIVVEPLVPEDFSGTPAELATLRGKLSSWDMYRRALVSDDLTATQLVVSLNIGASDAGKPASIRTYREIRLSVLEAGFEATNVYLAGLPVISEDINAATRKDLIFLVPLVILVVLLVLSLSFRRAGGIVLPLLTVAISAIWAIGAMPLFGIQLSIISTVLPVILVAVGSAYGIHIVSHYYDEMAGQRELGDEEHRAIIYAVIRRIGWPVFLAALTTFAGFVSFCFTKVVPIFEFGIFSSFGVAVAFMVALTLVPALLIIRGPLRKRPRYKIAEVELGSEDPLSAAIADALGAVAVRKRSTIFISILVVAVSIVGVTRVIIDNVLVEYFKPDADIARSELYIREKFGGTKSVSVVVSSPTPGEVLRPDVLAALDGLGTYLQAKVPEVGKITSFTDLVKRINQVFNVDASAEGWTPRAAGADDGAAFGFGALEASGATEPAFGFASLPVSGTPGPRPADAAPAAAVLDAKALAALFGEALAEGEGSDFDARELVRRLHRAVNYRGAAYYEVPTDPAKYGKKDASELKALVSNYLVLLSGDIGAFADDPLEPKAIRMNIQLRTVGQIDTNRAITAIQAYVDDRFPKDVKVEIGGTALVEESLNRLVVQSQMVSMILSLALVFVILAIFYRSAIAGLIGLAPLSVSILINFGVMGLAGIKLNIGTAMVASIAVGTGIDYTIHYMAAYHHEYLLTGGKGDFMRRTFLTSGKAILFNAVSVGAGFAVLGLSQFVILANLGLLIALTMGTSAVVALTLLPALLRIFDPAFIKRPLGAEKAETSAEASK
jgi:predicted RND superfamily exporter protein